MLNNGILLCCAAYAWEDVLWFGQHGALHTALSGYKKSTFSFTNYVYKKRWVGSPKMLTFSDVYKVENVNGVAVGGQQKDKNLSTKVVNAP